MLRNRFLGEPWGVGKLCFSQVQGMVWCGSVHTLWPLLYAHCRSSRDTTIELSLDLKNIIMASSSQAINVSEDADSPMLPTNNPGESPVQWHCSETQARTPRKEVILEVLSDHLRSRHDLTQALLWRDLRLK